MPQAYSTTLSSEFMFMKETPATTRKTKIFQNVSYKEIKTLAYNL